MDKVKKSIDTSLINSSINSRELFQHQLVTNEEGKKMVTVIRKQLRNCDEFYFSVAFITKAGISMIKEELIQLEKKGIRGYILTGLYLDFTEPAALRELNSFTNIEVKVSLDDGFHSKGYIFKNSDIYTTIIGSSNFTGNALTKNAEWNLKFSATSEGKIVKDILKKFNESFNEAENLEAIIRAYEENYAAIKAKEKLFVYEFQKNKKIMPNIMQEEALLNLENIRKSGGDKALLVSATGTGKTYFTAFDVKAYNPKKCLFIVHRENIAKSAMNSFMKIMPDKKMGLYTGSIKEDCDYQFSTIQTLTRDQHLHNFAPEEFDYIIIDEVHHVGAPTYQKLTNYFKPKFLLGMTATPDRSDSFNVFETFDYNVAGDIKLKEAMEMDLLVPFRYFGISDVIVDGQEIDETSGINFLCSEDRINHLVTSLKKYGHSGETLHGLIFVSRVEEAKLLEVGLQNRGINAVALDGSNTEVEREVTIHKLEKGIIDYIITIDIFNEGIDIPCVNQVVLLRPTESSIIYVQQIGRGLRKSSNKDYVTIIDVIGNYKKSYNNIIALSQDRTGSKDQLKYFLKYGTDILYGESTISFDEITEEKIYKIISESKISSINTIKKDYENLKAKLGKIPLLLDFYNNNLTSPVQILKESTVSKTTGKVSTKYRTYYDVLSVLEEGFILLKEEQLYLQTLSRFFSPAKRVHDWFIIKMLLEKPSLAIEDINTLIEKKYGIANQLDITINACMHLSGSIFTSLSDYKKVPKVASLKDGIITISEDFLSLYTSSINFKLLVDDLCIFNLLYVSENYKPVNSSALKLYGLYSKMEAHKYANFDYSNGFQVSGYNFNADTSEVVTFITLNNSSSYGKQIKSPETIIWFSKNKRQLKRGDELTNEGKIALGLVKVHIFVKKQNGENFYYLGTVKNIEDYKEIENNQGQSLVKYTFNLSTPIDEKIYDLLNN